MEGEKLAADFFAVLGRDSLLLKVREEGPCSGRRCFPPPLRTFDERESLVAEVEEMLRRELSASAVVDLDRRAGLGPR